MVCSPENRHLIRLTGSFARMDHPLYSPDGISLALYWSAEYGNPNAPGSWYFDSTVSPAVVTVVLNCILPLLALIDIVCLIGFILTNMYFLQGEPATGAPASAYLAWVSLPLIWNLSLAIEPSREAGFTIHLMQQFVVSARPYRHFVDEVVGADHYCLHTSQCHRATIWRKACFVAQEVLGSTTCARILAARPSIGKT